MRACNTYTVMIKQMAMWDARHCILGEGVFCSMPRKKHLHHSWPVRELSLAYLVVFKTRKETGLSKSVTQIYQYRPISHGIHWRTYSRARITSLPEGNPWEGPGRTPQNVINSENTIGYRHYQTTYYRLFIYSPSRALRSTTLMLTWLVLLGGSLPPPMMASLLPSSRISRERE